MWTFTCSDFDSLIQQEVNDIVTFETMNSSEGKHKGVQYRNRTTFTPEQSRALEQGDLKSSAERNTDWFSTQTTTEYTLASLPSEFSNSQYADMYTREKLSAEIKLPEDTIKVDARCFLSSNYSSRL